MPMGTVYFPPSEVMGMIIYLAADYLRKSEMQGVRDFLKALGHKVTSRWIDTPDAVEVAGIGSGTITDYNYSDYACHAKQDWSDIYNADTFVLFTTGEKSRGGRHTEFGIAATWDKRLIVVGPREHVFHCIPEVQHYPSWRAFAASISKGYLD